jgi:hypothetical protein
MRWVVSVLGFSVFIAVVAAFRKMTSGSAEQMDHWATVIPAILTLGAAAVQITLWIWPHIKSPSPKLQTAAQTAAAGDRLAQEMSQRWSEQAADRGIITPAPVRVAWSWGPEEISLRAEEVLRSPVPGAGPTPMPRPQRSATEQPEQAANAVPDAGAVTRLHDLYEQLDHGRLVLIGRPGAGKTGAMILLLLAVLEHRRAVEPDQRDKVPVPVWLTLGGWDPSTTSLVDWVVATMNRDHPYLLASDFGPAAARGLLQARRVALFLDGLDEMPPASQSAALDRIRREAPTLRIVMTSRPTEYERALVDGHLTNAAVIQLLPVDPDTAGAYLSRDHPHPANRRRWEHLAAHLTSHPNGALAHALDKPADAVLGPRNLSLRTGSDRAR